MSTNFEQLRGIRHPKVPSGNCNGVSQLYDLLIKEQFKDEYAIRKTHEGLIKYIFDTRATFFIRLYGSFPKADYYKQRRGFLSIYPNGTKTVFCDNTFSLLFAGMKLNGFHYSDVDLRKLLDSKDLVVGFGLVSAEKELAYYNNRGVRYDLNSSGWYQAHIKPTGKYYNDVKSLKNIFPNPAREEYEPDGLRFPTVNLSNIEMTVLRAHFLRLIHPLNSFLVPKRNHIEYSGSNIGEEDELILHVKDQLRNQFGDTYEEFDKLSLNSEELNQLKHIGEINWFESPLIAPQKPSKGTYYRAKKAEPKYELTNDLPIGKYVQHIISQLEGTDAISEHEIKNLLDPDYSKAKFNLNYSLLRPINLPRSDKNGYPRYYSKPFYGKYWLCSQWYEYHRDLFLSWVESIQDFQRN